MDAAGLGRAGGRHPPVAVAAVPLAFYGAAVALGVLEVVEWPVTLLVVAGTYLTDRATSTDNAADSPASPSSTGVDPSAPPPARPASDLVVPSPVEQHTGGAS